MEKISILTNAIIEKILKGYVDNLKETVSEKLAKECQRYSGMNDSLTNRRIHDNVKTLEHILWELEIDTRIDRRTVLDEKIKVIENYLDSIKKIKNEFVDTLIPQSYRGKSDYQINMKIAGKLADMLENLLSASYMDGLNTRLFLDTADKDGEVEKGYIEKEKKRIDDELEKSYNKGGMILALMMSAAINGDKVAEDFLNKK